MKPRQIEFILAIATVAAVAVTITSSTPIPSKDPIASRSETVEPNLGKAAPRRQKVIGTCLRIAPDLPPCNFDSQATWRSRSSEILHGDPAGSVYPVGEMPEYMADGSSENILADGEATEQKDGSPISSGEKDLEGFDIYDDDLAITVVYYLERCLPERVPFDLPSCPVDELQTIQMNKLVPFQLPNVEDDALIFPEIDVKQIEFEHRQSRATPSSQSHEEGKKNEHGFDGSARREKFRDRSSSSSSGNGNRPTAELGSVKTSTRGVQDFHKTMLKSSMNPRTGTASTKYVNMPAASGFASMVGSGHLGWVSEKKKEGSLSLPVVSENEQRQNPEGWKPPGEVQGVEVRSIGKVGGSRELGDVLAEDKNRVQ